MKRFFRFLRNVFSKSDKRRFAALVDFGHFIYPNYRFCWPQMTWWEDEEFQVYLERFKELDENNNHRKWTLSQIIRLVDTVPGSTVECGVYLGASSYLICAANASNKNRERIHYCFDSFQGLSSPMSIDGQHWKEGDLKICEDIVRENLSPFIDAVRLYKGWIPERFDEVEDCRFCFVHVDVDLYAPTWDSISFFYERLNKGGILLCDDYGFLTCPGATSAIDNFLIDKPEKMVSLDCGGGFFIKGVSTGDQASLMLSQGVF